MSDPSSAEPTELDRALKSLSAGSHLLLHQKDVSAATRTSLSEGETFASSRKKERVPKRSPGKCGEFRHQRPQDPQQEGEHTAKSHLVLGRSWFHIQM